MGWTLADLQPPLVLLEDRLTPAAPARLYSRPVAIVRCDALDQVDEAFRQLEAGLARGLHVAGLFAYELGSAFEPRLTPGLPAHRPDPLLHVGLFGPPQRIAPGDLDALFAATPPPPPLTDLRPGRDRAEHVARVREILAMIGAGDLYQANLTFPIRFRHSGDPLGLYAALRVRQPTAHSGLAQLGGAWVLSVSPELFLRVDAGQAESRPMKGTAARGGTAAADAEIAQALAADPKQRAENLMITDLIRNDLARICEPGTVRTTRLFAAETHPTFHALTSTVTGRLRPGLDLRTRLAAVFPCGSIVGAPKIRAAEVLVRLEDGARGLYTGALGYIEPGGDLALNVAIRTAVLHGDGTGVYGVGGGIVADSDPDGEYDEALLKARVLQGLGEDYGLIETLRWSVEAGFVRLARHLDRLAGSAAALAFAFDRPAVECTLADRAQTWAAAGLGDRRVRLHLSRGGEVAIADAPAPPCDKGAATVGFATAQLDAGDPFLRHKTTHRSAYDAAAAEAGARGWDEALLLNRSGELADGARHSVFAQIGDRLVTPPLTSGALPGVLRAELLERGLADEGVLRPEDLARCDALHIGNSLRGLRRARLSISRAT